MADEKRTTVGLSITPSLLAAVDEHAASLKEDRSTYFRRLAAADLQAAGKLPGSAEAEDLALFLEQRRLLGRDQVRAALVALTKERVAAAPEASAA